MADPLPHDDEHEQAPAAANTVGSLIAAAQESAERLQDAAAELQEQASANTDAARRTATEQHERELERARLAIKSLMSHIDTVRDEVMTSTERIRRVADSVAHAAEEAAEQQLRALRERVEAASSAVDLIASGMRVAGGELEEPAAPAREGIDDAVARLEPDGVFEDDEGSPAAELLDEEPVASSDAVEEAPQPASDIERARLSAVNLALNGTPREETARHLADSFDLGAADAEAMLDDVYRLADEAGGSPPG